MMDLEFDLMAFGMMLTFVLIVSIICYTLYRIALLII